MNVSTAKSYAFRQRRSDLKRNSNSWTHGAPAKIFALRWFPAFVFSQSEKDFYKPIILLGQGIEYWADVCNLFLNQLYTAHCTYSKQTYDIASKLLLYKATIASSSITVTITSKYTKGNTPF